MKTTHILDSTPTELEAATMIRAASHATSPVTRQAQRWQSRVTDLEVTRVMYQLELGTRLLRGKFRWSAPAGSPLNRGERLTTIVNEMIRTGLLRDYRSPSVMHTFGLPAHTLIPALVHALDGEHSLCLFTGEDMGPMRARLVAMEFGALVDCRQCLHIMATGDLRAL